MRLLDESPCLIDCNGESLVGVIHPAAKVSRLGVVIVVGGPQYRVGSHRQFVLMARFFAKAGYPVLRFDYRGMGDSSGNPRSFENVNDDISAAIEAFRDAEDGPDSVVLLGLCDAASASLLYLLTGDRRVAGCILVNPWVRTTESEARATLSHYYGRRILQGSFWRKLLSGRVSISAAIASFISNLARSKRGKTIEGSDNETFIERMRKGLEHFDGQVLILISGRDLTAAEFVNTSASTSEWRKAMRRPTVFRYDLISADHTFSSRKDLDKACKVSVDWLREKWR